PSPAFPTPPLHDALPISDRVEAASERRLRIHGRLTLRGVTLPLVLEAVVNDMRRHPMPPFRRTAGFSAVGTLSRSDFGISAWPRSEEHTSELQSRENLVC